jgi:hypothetical protein
MSILPKGVLATLAVLAFGMLSHAPGAFAQAPGAQSSVLPTGGGAALLDPSDTVILLLDHGNYAIPCRLI